MKKLSLIISFYSNIEYLKLVFAGLKRQKFSDFEIIIADDGSPEIITNEVQNLIRESGLSASHLWHEDKGFRKNKILNQAIMASQGDYLIFIDGDCVPHKNFIDEHLSNNCENVCLTGRRVNLSEKITGTLTSENVENGELEKLYPLVIDGIFGKSFDVEKGIYLKNKFLRKNFNKKKRGILGCNFSLFKKDILAINGFDERYEAPSIGEDSDIQFRLELNNVVIKSLNNVAVQYHLYHKLQPRPQVNLDLFDEVKKAGLHYTSYGIVKNN